MRLKQHHEDVKDLRLMSDAHIQDIAERYRNLIWMVENVLLYGKRKKVFFGLERIGSIKRVLKDAEPDNSTLPLNPDNSTLPLNPDNSTLPLNPDPWEEWCWNFVEELGNRFYMSDVGKEGLVSILLKMPRGK